MPAPCPALTEDQKRYIETNHHRMSFKEMAKNQHTSILKVREYMVENNLPFRITTVKKNEGRKKNGILPGFFDPAQFTNWII